MLYIDTIQIVRQNERKLTKPEQIKVGGDHIKKCNFTFFLWGYKYRCILTQAQLVLLYCCRLVPQQGS